MRDLHVRVGEERQVEFAQTPLLSLHVAPCEMRELRVRRAGNYLAADLPKVSQAVVECEDLGWAYKSAADEEGGEDNRGDIKLNNPLFMPVIKSCHGYMN